MTEKGQRDYDLMLPKVDYVFKLLFGDEKNKDILIAFLSDLLQIPREEFADLAIINTELLKEYKEDKKGIMDVRVMMKRREQVNIEIQISSTGYFPRRTLYYLGKMYISQIQEGDRYDQLKKCISINIVDFKCLTQKKLYSHYCFTDPHSGHILTDIQQIYFLELPKLRDPQVEQEEEDPVRQWMTFISAGSREVMNMLAQKNPDIGKAVNLLERISQDELRRMAYEARLKEMLDQASFIYEAEERGREEGRDEGRDEGRKEVARQMLLEGEREDKIGRYTGLSPEEIGQLKEPAEEK